MNLITKWRQWGIFILLFALLETTSWGSTNTAASSPTAPEGHRFLLIIETSKGMQRQGQAALAAIDGLLNSGMHGLLQQGDTIGLWTYNDELYTGRLQAQGWTSKTAEAVHDNILDFITKQKLEKSGDLKKVLPRLARVVNDSELITVILVNNGEDPMTGTPYDRQINEYYKTWREKQRKTVNPFVTVLRGERGKLTQYSVCQLPWTIELPPLPPGRVAQLAQHKQVTAPVKKAPPQVGKPLIVSGSSRKTESIDGVKSAPSATAIPQPLAQPIPQPTVREAAKDPKLETAEEIVARLLAEAGQPQGITPPVKVISTHGSTSSPAGFVVSTPRTNADVAASYRPQTPVLQEATVHSNATANIMTQLVAAGSASNTSAVPAKAVEPAAIVNLEPVPKKPEPVEPSAIAMTDTPDRISESPATTVQAAAAAMPESFMQRKPVQRAAMALAAGAIVCLFIAVRRPKSFYQPSIITRSLERESR